MTYKFTNLPNINVLKEDCEVHLITILAKFDEEKGSKAFAYFTVVTKHWFIHQVKKNAKQQRLETNHENISKHVEMEYLSIENPYESERNQKEFIEALWTEMNSWEISSLKENERKVLQAIKILLKEPDAIQIFNKKAVYLSLRQITGLNTKQVLNNLNKFRKAYSAFKHKWDNGEK